MDVKISQIISDGGFNTEDTDLLITTLKESEKYKNRVKTSFRGTVVEGNLVEIVNDLDALLNNNKGYKDKQSLRDLERQQELERQKAERLELEKEKLNKQKRQNSEYIRQQEEIVKEREKQEAIERAKQYAASVVEAKRKKGFVYDLKGNRGRSMTVFADRVVITVVPKASSLITGNYTDGEKTIFFHDVIGVQFKKSSGLVGYLQFETASGLMNNATNNMFNENTFTFDETVVSNEKMREVADYVIAQISLFKQALYSNAEEIKKYKELLDLGAITTEEYEAKKKQLLNI